MATDSATSALSKLQWDKKLLDRPEGKLALLGLILMGGAAIGAIGYFLVPIVTTILWNVVNMGIAAGVVGLMAITAGPLSKFIWKRNERFWRKMHEWAIKVDPISAMHEFLDYFERRMSLVSTSIQAVLKVRNIIKSAFDAAQNEAQRLVEQWKVVKDKPDMQREAMSLKRRADRATENLRELQQQLALVERFIRLLKKYQAAVTDKHQDIKEQIVKKERQYEMALQTQSAVEAMRDVFNSGSEEAEDFDLALRATDEKWADAIAGAEMFEMESQDVLTKIRIGDLDAQENGAAKLDELERMLDTGIFTRTRVRTDEAAVPTDEEIALAEQEAQEASAGDDVFAKLYSTKR